MAKAKKHCCFGVRLGRGHGFRLHKRRGVRTNQERSVAISRHKLAEPTELIASHEAQRSMLGNVV